MPRDLENKSVLCSGCYHYIVMDGKIVKCTKEYFKPIAIKKTTVYTPLDFDCWEHENDVRKKRQTD